jgi:RHS repeat-associated protein
LTPTETPEDTPTPTETPQETPTPSPTATDTAVPTVTSTPIPAVFANAEFTYDGDGKRVKSVMTMTTSVATTYFVGTHYEVTGSTVTKYYYAGSQRIAMRKDGTLNFIVGDHLGSTSLVTDASGNVLSEMRYKAWGEVRHESGSMSTQYQYTGQYSYASDFGLHFYNARWYDSSLSRFAQADTIVPSTQGVQGYDRYAYTNNNPVRYTDPTGHRNCEEDGYNCPGDKITIWDRIKISGRTAARKWIVPAYAETAFYRDDTISCQWGPGCLFKMMGAALKQQDRVVLSGQGLNNLMSDQRLLSQVQERIVESVKNDPRYGVEAFTRHRSEGNSVTFGDGEGNKLQDAFYSQTWYARAAKIDADIQVTETGEIHIMYTFEDTLDLRPDWDNEARNESGYNFWTGRVFGPIWHDLLGASDTMKVNAYWLAVVK